MILDCPPPPFILIEIQVTVDNRTMPMGIKAYYHIATRLSHGFAGLQNQWPNGYMLDSCDQI